MALGVKAVSGMVSARSPYRLSLPEVATSRRRNIRLPIYIYIYIYHLQRLSSPQ